MSKIKETEKPNFLVSLATFIVDKRNLFFLLFIFAGIFSIFSSGWVKVEEDITKYLPKTTETRRGVTLMDKEFVTYATADIMVSNVSYDRAEDISEMLEDIKGVSSVDFDNSEDHFKKASALYSVTFDGMTEDEVSVKALNQIRKKLDGYEFYVKSDVGNSDTESLAKDMNIIIVIAAVIIVLVLLFTSRSYAEIPVLIITFAAAALLNKGTNFMLGKISFISNSVAVVLQLALAIDYAIIFCHRYSEEHEKLPSREAAIAALSKAIVEISSSSLTTVSGLAALVTMQFGIGRDLAFVLIKAIILSMLSVFTLMPGLLILFSKWIDKTVHRNFVPKISKLGHFVNKTKYIVPPIFAVIMIVAFIFSSMCPYCYGNTNLSTPKKDEKQIARDKINSTFKQKNMLALIVPAGNYEKENALLTELEKHPEVDTTLGLSNTEALDGYMLTDKLKPREFSELTDVDFEAAELLYGAYAVREKDYGQIINDLDAYGVPLIDMLEFLHEEIEKKYITLDDELTDDINEIYDKITDAKKQLQSKKYSRMLVYLTLPEESNETFAFLNEMHSIVKKYYSLDDSYIVGNTTSDYDLSSSFSRDNLIISILSALFVILVLLFTFMSAGLPLLLIAVIQGSIWINFSFPYLMDSKLYFLGYLIVNSIQMGANIDYAIVISTRYTELKQSMPKDKAMVEALNQAFPTILTSGAILAAAGILIGQISTNGVISAIGVCLGRGTIISIVLVMAVLPQIMLLGDAIIERTSFKLKAPELVQKSTGTVFVNGRVRGKVNGIVDAYIHGLVIGDVNAMIQTGESAENGGEAPPDSAEPPADGENPLNGESAPSAGEEKTDGAKADGGNDEKEGQA